MVDSARSSRLCDVRPTLAYDERLGRGTTPGKNYVGSNPPYGATIWFHLREAGPATVTIRDGGAVIARLTGIPALRQYRVYLPIILAAALMGATIEGLILLLEGKVPDLGVLFAALTAGAAVYAGTLFASAKPALKTGYSFLTHLKPGQSSV